MGEIEYYSNKQEVIGFQGVNGSYSEEALITYFGEKAEKKAFEEFEDVFIALENEEIKYGVLPIENSSTGAIKEVYDLLIKYGFYIVGEQCTDIKHMLVARDGVKLEQIEEVYSHSQGFEQCTQFLKNFSWKKVPYYNTAISAKLVSEDTKGNKAAIASLRAAKEYRLNVLCNNISNKKTNTTRFIVVGKKLEKKNPSDLISICFSLEHKAGALYEVIKLFAEKGINLLKIESRPKGEEPWRYIFFMDFEGNMENEGINQLIEELIKLCLSFKLLGVYKSNR